MKVKSGPKIGVKPGRTIQVIGGIDEEAYKAFSEAVSCLEVASGDPIGIELNSDGGSSHDALAFAARMRLSRCKFRVTVYGKAYSAATLILAVGDHRRMTRESWVMVHEDSDTIKGDVAFMEREAAQYRRLETQWNEILADVTKLSADEWEEYNKRTVYLEAQECLQLGLIDEVI